MLNHNLITPTARQVYHSCYAGKILMFLVFVFWTLPSMRATLGATDKWGPLVLALALSFGIVFLTAAATKEWMSPKRSGIRFLGLAILALFSSVVDLVLVHQRIKTGSVNYLTQASGGASDTLSYLISGILLALNLGLALVMSSAYYRAGLHEEAEEQNQLDSQVVRQEKEEQRSRHLEKLATESEIEAGELAERVETARHVAELRRIERDLTADRKNAEAEVSHQDNEKTRLQAKAMELENKKANREMDRLEAAEAGDEATPVTIDADYSDVTDPEAEAPDAGDVVPFSRPSKK